MITDALSLITGRTKNISEIIRLVNKSINIIIYGDRKIGKTFCLRRVFEQYANSQEKRKIIYLKAHSSRRDFEEMLFVMQEKYNDIPKEEKIKLTQHVLERRILTAVKNSPSKYLIFIEEQKKLSQGMILFFSNLLKTGNVVLIAETNTLKDAKVREFYQTFEHVEIKALHDDCINELFDYLVKEESLNIKKEEYAVVKKCIVKRTAGSPRKLRELLARGSKEREIKKVDVEKFPSSYRKEVGIGWTLTLFIVVAMAYRFFLRASSSIADTVMGGVVFAISLLCYRLISRVR
ncbi:MAG: hypothetical protein KAI26_09450 [Nanoarchaeota archaeon]|nr:hypothetical protein [Nanoarchaeota archaeon]